MTVRLKILAIILEQCFIYVTWAEAAPEVVTSVGTIRGVRAEDGDYSMFMGIPFARVNVSNVFGDSIPHPNFDSVFEANDDSVACPQIEEFNDTYIGSLDCLNLNIYVPDTASTQNPLPVMLYIFGGGFNLGFPSRFILGPKFLVRHDVIFVTINYRLGPYGFMCLHTPEVPGNQGLRDQVMAMQWVKNHIAAFGGDPDRVTIFGNSAGGMSVDYHVLSETEPLFHGVILQSGTAFFSPMSGLNVESSLSLAEALGLTTSDLDEALEYIASLEPAIVIQATSDAGITFAPCIETDIEGVTKVISDNPVNLQAPKASGLKVMIGSNDDELLVAFAALPALAFPFLSVFIGEFLNTLFIFDDETAVKVERSVRNFYIGDEDFTSDIMFQLSDFFSDIMMVYSTERTIKQYLDSEAEVFYYVFSYTGGRNFNKLRNGIDIGGAYHADELGYLFDMKIVSEEPTPEDQLIIDRMTTLWTNFAKYGSPTPETTELLPAKWQPITKGSVYHYMNITTDINAGRRPFSKRMVFWDVFYEAYGRFERTRQVSDDDDIDGDSASNAINMFPPLVTVLLVVVSRIIVS